MTQTLDNPAHWSYRRQEWITRVTTLVHEIATWSQAQGWKVEEGRKSIHEKLLGDYEVPTLLVHLPEGELSVNPVGLQVIGADGRIDVEAFPTLSRVKFVGDGEGWKIVTDSNVPLRAAWNCETFVQLAHDLLN